VRLIAFGVTTLMALAVATAALGQPLTREQALTGLKNSGDVEARRQGVASLGDTGVIADVPLLVEALRDSDEMVRALAEHSLWQVWSRSGDSEVDGLFQLGLEQKNQRDAAAAIQTFTLIIQKKPDFAEGGTSAPPSTICSASMKSRWPTARRSSGGTRSTSEPSRASA